MMKLCSTCDITRYQYGVSRFAQEVPETEILQAGKIGLNWLILILFAACWSEGKVLLINREKKEVENFVAVAF